MLRLQIEKANSQFLLNANCRKTAFVVVFYLSLFSSDERYLTAVLWIYSQHVGSLGFRFHFLQ